MERNKKHIIPLLLLAVLLAGALFALYGTYSDFRREPPMTDDPPVEELPSSGNTSNGDEENREPATEPDDPPVADLSPVLQQPVVTLRDGMYTYSHMRSDLVELAARYPRLLQVSTYGESADGRDLYMAKFGNPNADKQVIITSGMHAREYVNCYVVMKQLEYYLQNYKTASYDGVAYEQLFSEVCLIIAPMTNPDGIMLAQEGIGSLRSSTLKTALESMVRSAIGDGDVDAYLNREWKTNARGVDINRNFDALWTEHKDGVNRPTAKNYKGETAGSEPETAALVRLTESLSNPVASVCVHMQGEVIYWRCYQSGEFKTENRRLAEIAAEVTGYTIIDSNETEPSYSNWTILAHEIPTITVETGISRYPLSYDLAPGILEKNLDLWAAVAKEYAAN